MRTSTILLGTMITPVSRMRPWKLASETATLDNLSDGRVILSVGLGTLESGFESLGEVTDRKTRAELLDEGLDILTGLWKGQPFNYEGKHYKIKETTFAVPPAPVQKPRIPIWVVGAWPREKSMQRALRYDGLLPNVFGQDGKIRMGSPTLDELRQIKEYVTQHRTQNTPFDIVVEGNTPGHDRAQAAAQVRPWEDAGATWWIESNWTASDLTTVLERIKQGPPRV
jgi:alkanesulfonate monooxygenase SsuD/methylene tetrahydromethanopterin reductase-like flavin-dependent oxidoreductase (luciferase family)